MDLQQPLSEDELAAAFPNCAMTHVLRVLTSRDGVGGLEVLQRLIRGGGELISANLALVGEQLDQRITLAGVSALQARAMADQLRDLPQVASVAVEHHVTAQCRRGPAA